MSLTFSETMQIGTKAPDFELSDFSGTTYTLKKLVEGKKGILVVFTCNHCPYAKAAWPILASLSREYPDIQFVAVNPNDAESYPEDSKDGMRQLADSEKLSFPYLVDVHQDTAKAYKAVCTPDPFLFQVENGTTSLFYHGRINDNWQHPEHVQEENLHMAIVDLIDGKHAPENQPPSMGCSIKWREPSEA